MTIKSLSKQIDKKLSEISGYVYWNPDNVKEIESLLTSALEEWVGGTEEQLDPELANKITNYDVLLLDRAYLRNNLRNQILKAAKGEK